MSIRPFLTTHIPINLPPLRPFHTDRMAALTFHPAACFFPRPREAAATTKQPLHHYCSPLRTLVPRTTRPCLLRARSSNGLPQTGGASFGSSNGIRWNMRAWWPTVCRITYCFLAAYAEVLDGTPTGDGAPGQGQRGASTVSITVVGASGDLAKKKIFPALFALFYEGWLPEVRREPLPRSLLRSFGQLS